jgi:phosphoribosylaminoimidazolecarboxamide formyltransferase/IMP cyclohydrolase
MDRPSAARLAVAKAGERAKGAVAASDAFFPFPDGPELLLDAGVTAIIHPGGSLKDQDTIDLANRRGAAVVLTGQRHFKH